MAKDKRKKKLSKEFNVKDKSGMIETLMTGLKNKGAVRLLHIGLFKVITIKDKSRYDFKSGKVVDVTPYKKISFTPSSSLKKVVNS